MASTSRNEPVAASSAPGPHGETNAGHHPTHRVKILALAMLAILGLSFGFLGGWLGNRYGNSSATTIQKQQVVLKTQGQVISAIAKGVGESVVSINTTSQTTTESFFGFSQSFEQQGAGTGIILTDDGLIVTNRHVVPAGTTKVSVTLADGTEYDNVTVVGRTGSADTLDIAFLKISDLKGKTLKPASLGDSSKMQVGDPVIAIGNALGQFQNTVTSGIISGYGRSLQASGGNDGSENLENLFQTDAAINAGNSGGPLVNFDGEVIAINTAKASGDAQGIGFAIPINDVRGLIDSVKKTGKLERPFLGVVYIPLTNDTAKLYSLSVTRGAYIAPAAVVGTDSVVDGGPADRAGLKEGDIITKINDVSVDQQNSLSAIINKYAVGTKVTLEVIRGDKTLTMPVTLGAAPAG